MTSDAKEETKEETAVRQLTCSFSSCKIRLIEPGQIVRRDAMNRPYHDCCHEEASLYVEVAAKADGNTRCSYAKCRIGGKIPQGTPILRDGFGLDWHKCCHNEAFPTNNKDYRGSGGSAQSPRRSGFVDRRATPLSSFCRRV